MDTLTSRRGSRSGRDRPAPEPSADALNLASLRAAASSQRPALVLAALLVYLPAVALLAVLAAATVWRGVPFALLASDPITLGRLPFYAGMLSNLGILFWCSAAAITLFAAALVWQTPDAARSRWFLLVSGTFTSILLLDDFFLIHEIVFPYYLGLPQELLLGTYVVGAITYLIIFRGIILRTDFLILLTAIAALAFSVVVDQLPQVLPMHLLWEDGAKLVGAAGWFFYFARTSAQFVTGSRAAQAFRP